MRREILKIDDGPERGITLAEYPSAAGVLDLEAVGPGGETFVELDRDMAERLHDALGQWLGHGRGEASRALYRLAQADLALDDLSEDQRATRAWVDAKESVKAAVRSVRVAAATAPDEPPAE